MRRTPFVPCALIALAVALGCAPDVADHQAAVVYETDGRTEVEDHPNPLLQDVARTVIAMKVDSDHIDATNPDDVWITYSRTLGEAQTLCPGERFADQVDPGTCSGTLLDQQHILTAGHCMDTASDCTGKRWVFGFRYGADGELTRLTSDDVYRCARVLAYRDDDGVDHAVVELDRPVVGRVAPSIRLATEPLAIGTPLALIGHPNGIPMKIDSGGVVTFNAADGLTLEATVDAFRGNSGSGVFDHNGRLVALLDGGEDDYIENGDCNVVNVIDPAPADDGESLTYLAPALAAYCSEPGIDSPVCGCDGPCVPALEGDTCDDATTLDAVDQTVSGSLARYTPSSRGSCGGAGPDRAYTFTLTEAARLTAGLSGYDSVMHLYAGCGGEELACNDDISEDARGSRFEVDLAAGTYTLVVDAFGSRIGSGFTLGLVFAPTAAPPPEDDAGPAPTDAGPPQTDAGAPPPPTSGGCRAVPNAGGASGWALLALVVCARSRRRRR
ncbi:MAG: serine protease [Sandaracinaceae bacterium]